MKNMILLSSMLSLAACVSGAGGTSGGASLLRPSTEAAAITARAQIANRTFFNRSGGQNIAGSIFFDTNGSATQAAEDRGVEKLTWAIETGVEGISGPAVCIAGRYYNNASEPATTVIQREGGRVNCAPVSAFTSGSSSGGNAYGLGTLLR